MVKKNDRLDVNDLAVKPTKEKKWGKPANPVKKLKKDKADTKVRIRKFPDDEDTVGKDDEDFVQVKSNNGNGNHAVKDDEPLVSLLEDEDEFIQEIEDEEDKDTAADFLFTNRNLTMKTQLSERLTVYENQALVEADEWDIPELRDTVQNINALRISLERQGRKEGVSIVKAEAEQQQQQQMLMPFTAPPQQQPNANPPKKKGWFGRIKEP